MFLPDILPTPHSVQPGNGRFELPMKAVLRLGGGLSEERAAEFASLWRGFCAQAGEIDVVRDETLSENEAVLGAGADVSLNAEDEYALRIAQSGVCVRGSGEIGLLHGLYTLLQLIMPMGEEQVTRLVLPEVVIHDRPRFKMRALHLCLFPENTLTVLEKAIRLAGIMKYSHVCIEFWGTLQYDALDVLAWKNHSWSKEQIRPLMDIARRMGLEVIPMFNHLGHASQSREMYGRHTILDQNPKYQPLFESDGWTWCLSNPKVHELLRAVRSELIELCGEGGYFHLGCDEAYSYATCPLCSEKDGVKMLSDYLNALTDELTAMGRKPIIWADTLLDRAAWAAPIVANSKGDQKTHMALDALDKRIVMADWQYGIKAGDVPTARHLMSSGFETLLCPFEAFNVKALGAAADEMDAAGLMVTTWHRLPELMRTLDIGAEYGWCGAKARGKFRPVGTAPLLRCVMSCPTYENAGFNQYEVLQPDRWLMK